MSVALCHGCGRPLEANAQFCGSCGVRRDEPSAGTTHEAQDTGPEVTSAEATVPVITAQPQPVPVGTHDDQTAPIASTTVPSRGGRGRTLALLFGMGLLIGLIAVAALGRLTPKAQEQPPGEIVAQLPIDPQGGEATFDGGAAKMSVPPGAVQRPQTVTIYKRIVSEQVRAVPPSGGQALVFPPGTLVTYIFRPITIRLNAPIILTIQLPLGQQGLVFVTAAGTFRFLPGVGTGNFVTIVLRSFNFDLPDALEVQD